MFLIVTIGGYSVNYYTIISSVSLKALRNYVVSIHDFPTEKVAVALAKDRFDKQQRKVH